MLKVRKNARIARQTVFSEGFAKANLGAGDDLITTWSTNAGVTWQILFWCKSKLSLSFIETVAAMNSKA